MAKKSQKATDGANTFEDALENDSIGLTTKDAQNEASNDA